MIYKIKKCENHKRSYKKYWFNFVNLQIKSNIWWDCTFKAAAPKDVCHCPIPAVVGPQKYIWYCKAMATALWVFQQLNPVTEPAWYPLSRMDDFSARLAGCTVIRKLSLKQGYHQIPMPPADISKTTITTPYGLNDYKTCPLVCETAVKHFKGWWTECCRGQRECFLHGRYLDGVRNREKNLRHLRALFCASRSSS